MATAARMIGPQLPTMAEVESRLVAIGDRLPATRGANVILVHAGQLRWLRRTSSPITIVYEMRTVPKKETAPPPPNRSANSVPTMEWVNLGFNCTGAVLGWIGVVGAMVTTPVGGPLSVGTAGMLWGGAAASTAQCAVSIARVNNAATGQQHLNDAMNVNPVYVWTMRAADFVGLVGAGGTILELVPNRALSAEAFASQTVRRASSPATRAGVAGALKAPGGAAVTATMIDQAAKLKLLEGVSAVVGIVGSGVGGLLKEVSDLKVSDINMFVVKMTSF